MAGAGAMKKVDRIRQIVRLKQLMMRWRVISHRRHHHHYDSSSLDSKPCTSSPRRAPSGFVFVYVGQERKRFVIPARFLNLPVFAGLLEETEEVFGLRCSGGLLLPCEVAFFSNIVKHLEKDEHKYGKLSLEDFVNMVSDLASDSSCKEGIVAFTPLLQKARV
ncbi:protein SMALL AUXIN UP-REGULATED RNA 51-like [Arachis duranensis]|uniref:Protein SMALL AUXIN UP-REGULATED RNA 51-like n=1 Tax=Arachis duranensis TaxID=130453 RepID=A0A6P4CRM3_ARADU|nr:protein SMALL AUXIN UP-REGULATED RNA 51-like [Arachis duranensis]